MSDRKITDVIIDRTLALSLQTSIRLLLLFVHRDGLLKSAMAGQAKTLSTDAMERKLIKQIARMHAHPQVIVYKCRGLLAVIDARNLSIKKIEEKLGSKLRETITQRP